MTSTTMFEMLATALTGPLAGMLARRLGTNEATVRKAIAIALPLLITALARNTSTEKGAKSLSGALARDHDGSVLGDMGGFLAGGDTTDGEKILDHVLGKKRTQAELGISQASGLDASAVSQLLALLAPLVLGYLGQQQRTQQLDPGGLGDLLEQEQEQVAQQPSDALGGLVDILVGGGGASAGTSGNTMQDAAAQMGVSMLRKWLAGRR